MEQETHRYDDIIDLPHHQSLKHRHMSMLDRAAQFMPFRALTGYGDCIEETARTTDRRVELDEGEKAVISEKLYLIQTALAQRPRGVVPGVRIEYFLPDEKKEGGAYRTITGAVKKVDSFDQSVTMQDGTYIPMEDIVAVAKAGDEVLNLPHTT